MAKKTVEIFLDDRDGSELPEGTQPIHLHYRDRGYELFLSESNAEELDRIISEFTRNADPYQSKGQASPAKRGASVNEFGYLNKTVRDWAQNEGANIVKEEGLTVPGERGRIDGKIHQLHHEANK